MAVLERDITIPARFTFDQPSFARRKELDFPTHLLELARDKISNRQFKSRFAKIKPELKTMGCWTIVQNIILNQKNKTTTAVYLFTSKSKEQKIIALLRDNGIKIPAQITPGPNYRHFLKKRIMESGNLVRILIHQTDQQVNFDSIKIPLLLSK